MTGATTGADRRMRTRTLRILAAACAALAVSGCAGPTGDGDAPDPSPAASAPIAPTQTTPTPTDPTMTEAPMPDTTTPITITIGDAVITASLNDSPAANALAAQLPLTMTFDDFNRLEKISTMAAPLPMDGMPSGDDPAPGDIGFWAPAGDLVLYYGDVGYFEGIARLGTFDDIAAIEQHGGAFTAVIALA